MFDLSRRVPLPLQTYHQPPDLPSANPAFRGATCPARPENTARELPQISISYKNTVIIRHR